VSTKRLKDYRGISCLNCNHPLDISDKFCPNCGQKNTTKRLALRDFIDEFLANFYAYDSKVKHTIVSLFVKPGKAAKEFITGKRLYYANPFRFYLSVSLIYFIFSGLVEKFGEVDTSITIGDNLSNSNDSISKHQEVDYLQAKIDSATAKRKKERNDIFFDSSSQKNDTLYTEKQIKSKSIFKRTFLKIDTYTTFLEKSKEKDFDKILDSLKHEKSDWNKFLLKKSFQVNEFNSKDDSAVEKFANYLDEKLPFILFISLPFLTIVFAIIYFRSKLNYAEHMVFVFSVMSFVFLLFFLAELINLLINIDLSSFIPIVLLFYLYKALRNFYQQSRLKTILKFVLLTFMLPTTALFVAVIMVFIGFILY
jgi:hypothetical protein